MMFESDDNANFGRNFKLFITRLNSNYTDKLKKMGEELVVMKGQKYYKIGIQKIGAPKGHYSVHCFVDKNTGLIYKAASWRAPAKGSRASIHDPETYKNADVYGGWLYRYN